MGSNARALEPEKSIILSLKIIVKLIPLLSVGKINQ